MKIKYNRNFQEIFFENLGIPQEVVLLFGNYVNPEFLFSASSLGCNHSELDIPLKDD